ncbi:MAG: penicillin-binding protein 1A [Vicinamibacterales bacterium]
MTLAVATLSVAWIGIAIFLVVFVSGVAAGLPGFGAVGRVTEMAQATTIYDRHDKPVFTIFKEQRIEVPLAEMSPDLVHAIVAIEDQRFYEHDGIDLVRVAGAVVANLRQGRLAQGGSTLTQQLARQSFLTLDKTYTRKAREVVLATLLEWRFSKDEILELYLNKVYFGGGLYGAEAASLGYFGRHASELTLSQAALLAGLVKAPSAYAPTTDLERAVARRDLVLDVMRDTGVIDEAAWKAATHEPVELRDALNRREPVGEYFKEQVRQELVKRYGEERAYLGGLKVYTTLDLPMQKAAEAEVSRALKSLDGRRRKGHDPLQAALVAMDPRTGEVRALVGGRDFSASKFNRATQARRQPGSAFKPFVYAAALESGYSPATILDHLEDPVDGGEDGPWRPADAHAAEGSLSMRQALRVSSNRAAVRMIEMVGIHRAVGYAARLGVPDLPEVPSVALGSGEVTLESLTGAYAVFASGGVRRPALYVRRVEDPDGSVVFEAPSSAEQVIDEGTAFLMSSMLADVVNHGTGWRARQMGFRLPAAGKTGTTNDYHDAWFVGYTPALVTGVWVGYDQPRPIRVNGYASDVAVPLWSRFMRTATKGDKAEWFARPDDIVAMDICRLSGKRPTAACDATHVALDEDGEDEAPMVVTEYFRRGTEPTEECDLHERLPWWQRLRGWFKGPGDDQR